MIQTAEEVLKLSPVMPVVVVEDVDAAEAVLPIDSMVDAAVAGVSVEDFRFPVLLEYPAGR